jgi:hypothetical protein
MKRDDLLKEVCNYEKESAKAADAKPPRPTIPTRPYVLFEKFNLLCSVCKI